MKLGIQHNIFDYIYESADKKNNLLVVRFMPHTSIDYFKLLKNRQDTMLFDIVVSIHYAL